MRSRIGAGSCGVFVLIAVTVVSGVAGAASGADDREAVRALAETINRHIATQWAENGVAPAPLAGDSAYLRRASLDLTGRIPAAGQVREFLDDSRPDKRERLVERLLESPAFVTHMTNLEMRLMMPEADANPEVQAQAPLFEAWLREQVDSNAGLDHVARAILTAPVAAAGAQAQRMPAAASNQKPSPLPYYLAKDVKSENLAASTARLFLGIRLECAQCHNHPFATWKRDQFWSYAAFFTSLERSAGDDGSPDPIRERPDRREATIPGLGKVVKATFLDGKVPQAQPGTPARVSLADWMTDRANPYFAQAAVNRIWAQCFGIGLVDPVDDMGAENPASHPELLDALAKSFAEHGYDRKFLIRAIMMSRPYQLSSAGAGASAEDPRLFARMRLRGLSAEQLYDSLAQAVGLPSDDARSDGDNGMQNSLRAEFFERFASQDEKPTEAQASILQALALMNGRLVAGATDLETGATLSAVAEAPFLDTAGRIEALYLATLSRRPRPEETARMTAYIERGGSAGDRRKALSDVLWALLNSPEFLLNH